MAPSSSPQSLLKRRMKRNRKVLLITSILAATASAIYIKSRLLKNPQHTSKISGREWMEELIYGHHRRIRDNLGVSQEGFMYLEDLLVRKGGLVPTRYMGTYEQLGIFLYAVTTDLSMRKLAERFQRSTETIQRTYHKVMKCFLCKGIYESAVQSVSETAPLSDSITLNSNYFPFFKDCVGAVDGTHIGIF
jgi:hypothetical protein